MTVSTAPSARAGLRLAHAVADHLAAAELDLFAIDRRVVARTAGLRAANRFGGQIAFHLDHQFGIGQTQPLSPVVGPYMAA